MEQGLDLLLKLAQPLRLVPILIALWLAVLAILARVSGWRSLGEQFATRTAPEGRRFRFVSATLGAARRPIRYRNCLHIVVGEDGLFVRVTFPLNFQSPPLFLPWGNVESVSEKRLFFARTVTFRFWGHWPAVTLSGQIGQLAKAAYMEAAGTQ
jgi:hypothetical protein